MAKEEIVLKVDVEDEGGGDDDSSRKLPESFSEVVRRLTDETAQRMDEAIERLGGKVPGASSIAAMVAEGRQKDDEGGQGFALPAIVPVRKGLPIPSPASAAGAAVAGAGGSAFALAGAATAAGVAFLGVAKAVDVAGDRFRDLDEAMSRAIDAIKEYSPAIIGAEARGEVALIRQRLALAREYGPELAGVRDAQLDLARNVEAFQTEVLSQFAEVHAVLLKIASAGVQTARYLRQPFNDAFLAALTTQQRTAGVLVNIWRAITWFTRRNRRHDPAEEQAREFFRDPERFGVPPGPDDPG